MNGESLTPQQEKLKQLKQLMPEAFAEGKVDWEKLKATLGEDVNFINERYVLNWAGKSDAFKTMQTPTSQTLVPVKEESVNFDNTENIFIEGENLAVLKVLQKSYFGEVKMIYIDPPYNTGNDSFIYPDKFSETKEEYAKRVGDKDEEGYLTKDGMFRKNSKENGQYHSNWLSMMMPRLHLAKNLLTNDGVIFVSIDDNEVHNLRLLMNEIFGEENFRNEIVIRRGAKSVQAQFDTWDKLGRDFEYILFYSKSPDYRFPNQKKQLIEHKKIAWNNHWRGTDRPTMRYKLLGITPEKGQWRWAKERSEIAIENYQKLLKKLSEAGKEISDDNIYKYYLEQNNPKLDLLRLSKSGKIEHFIAPSNETLLNSSWIDLLIGSSSEIYNLFDFKIFDTAKLTTPIKRMLNFIDKNEIVLDFFAGSGTTANAVMQLNAEDGGNRKCISVQLPELCDEKTEAYKAGYKTIADISKERIRRAGKKILIDNKDKKCIDKLDTGFKVFKLTDSNFKQWQATNLTTAEQISEQLEMFVDPVVESATIENMLFELLLKSGKDLNSQIANNNGYYVINDTEMVFILEQISQGIIEQVLAIKPKQVIALDRLFKGNDQLKTNTVLQMCDAAIDFKTI